MTSRGIILAAALLFAEIGASGAGATPRVVVHLVGCVDCASHPPRVRISDEGRGDDRAPVVSQRREDGFVLTLEPGYYRLFLRSRACDGDRYLGVLPHRNRRFDIRMSCLRGPTGKPREIARLVDAMQGLAGAVPRSVQAISMWPVDESERTFQATISGGAYYFDEANCTECVLQLALRNGRSARIGVSLRTAKNFTLLAHDISPAELTAGTFVHGSPFNAPATLVEGPARSIWALDRLGNRVAKIDPAAGGREYDLPTPFADAGDIVGTEQYVWVSERRVGRLVRISPNGAMVEYSIGSDGFRRNLRIAVGGDGRIWFVDNERLGAVDRDGHITTYPLSGPVFWLRDLTLGSDGRIWVVGLRSSYAEGSPFLAAIDPAGHSQEWSIPYDAATILAAKGGVWISGDYDFLSFVDAGGHEKKARLPIARMAPRLYAVDPSSGLWFSDRYGNVIAHASPNGSVEATYPDFGPAGISDMRIDHAGDVWIAEPKAHTIEQYRKGFAIPPPGIYPKHLLFDSAGNLWYSDPDADVVGVIGKDGRARCFAFRLSRVRSCWFGRMDIVATSVPGVPLF